MTLLIKGSNIAAIELDQGVKQQLLLNRHETGGSRLEIKKIILSQNTQMTVPIEKGCLSWFHPLSPDIHINSQLFDVQSLGIFTDGTSPVFSNVGNKNAEILYCTIPFVSRFLSENEEIPFISHIVDWSVEPVLLSEFDSRKRIYLASPGLWKGVSCVKGEMIIYPKGGTAPFHHHEDAEHFQYIMDGFGTVFFDNQEHIVEKGDILYFFENEVHAFENKNSEHFVFAEFFVPGSYKTIWAKNTNICTWIPTGNDVNGRKASRHLEKHVAGEGNDI
ncbi:cupin domain-containing protein [Alphaproteobacteria bacterium]|nr:cupin domain-containing protein [Alphaproteobacteria bacterium]